MREYVNYEDFGAVGDGKTNDFSAIIAAHDYANAHNLPVRTKPDATYYIGGADMRAIIKTDTDWSTTRFTIDDRNVSNLRSPCFEIVSQLEAEDVRIEKLQRSDRSIAQNPKHSCFVTVYNDNILRFKRYGLNQSKGNPTTDSFVLNSDGSIYGPIDWDYDEITRIETRPVDDNVLTVRGGVFTTIANADEPKYKYYLRGIVVHRSRVNIEHITHYVCGETNTGNPYGGFLYIEKCAYVNVTDSFFCGHKIYYTTGAAGLPVPMGSYDIQANSAIDVAFRSCRINNINDNTRWGVIGTNFCKNLLVDGCEFSRLDAHQGVSGYYAVKNSVLGWQCLNAIGRGKLIVENTTLYGNALICFRDDYGSTWDGDVEITNCRWIPSWGRQAEPKLFFIRNNRMHDFGYPCHMPRNIVINNLFVDDSNVPDGYTGPEIFSDPDRNGGFAQPVITEPRPCVFEPTKRIEISGFSCASGKPLSICSNTEPFTDTIITVNGTNL